MPHNQSFKESDALQTSSTSIDATDQARAIYFHFRKLGLPHSVTFEGFFSVYTLGLGGKGDDVQTGIRNLGHSRPIVRSKLCPPVDKETNHRKGKWKETLDMVAQRLVGRNEAARVRAFVSAATSRGAALNENPMKMADDRRESLYRVLGSVQKEWDIENRQLMDLDRRKRELKGEIEHKRKVVLLLNVLEKREEFRMKRIGCVGKGGSAGIGDMIKRSRTEAVSNFQVFQDVINGVQKSECDIALASSFLQNLQRRPNLSYKHSTNALANLHSYHTRLVHMKTRTRTTQNGEAEDGVNKRIENSLKALGIRDVQNTKRRLEEVARLRAERKRKFNIGSVTDSSVSEVQLEELLHTNEGKKKEVQQQLNRAIALGWVCEGYVDLIATFREQTAPSLDDSMSEEQKRIERYVDKMKMAIIRQRRKTSASFSQRAREIVGTDKVKVWEEVEDDLKYSSPKVDIMVLGQEKDLVVDEMDVSNISRLLERKKQKAEVGCAMGEEIQGLLQGFKKLKYI